MKVIGLFALSLLACAPGANAAPANCETLRASIQERIRSNGVADATVVIDESTAPPRGKVVGTCELGTKRLVQLARPPATAPGPSQAKAKGSRVITECDDGRVVKPGPCKP